MTREEVVKGGGVLSARGGEEGELEGGEGSGATGVSARGARGGAWQGKTERSNAVRCAGRDAGVFRLPEGGGARFAEVGGGGGGVETASQNAKSTELLVLKSRNFRKSRELLARRIKIPAREARRENFDFSKLS